MSQIDAIREPVRDELAQFNQLFSESMKSDIPLLNLVTRYLLKRKGKQIRPLLIFLSAGMIDTPTPATHTAAALAELLHTATLIHDDVVDDANERRGFLSIKALWKSKIAVLIGDFLLSKGLITAIENKAYDILGIFTDAVKQMSEGELYQIQKSRKLNITEEEYYAVIEKKTASLLAACTAAGARSVTQDSVQIEQLKQIGLNLGMAFQIQDDLFDYDIHSLTGKPKGNDIQEKKLTLPLIYALQQAPVGERKSILRSISTKSKKRSTQQKVVEFVHTQGGIEYAKLRMQHYTNQALEGIRKFPPSNYRNAMEELVGYVISRKK